MDRARIERLEALLAKATPGPWECGQGLKHEPATTVYCDDSLGSAVATCAHAYTVAISRETEAANAALIAEAINALPALLRLARAAREDAARLEALENKINEDGGLVLHNGNFTGNYAGLGLRNTSRTLRQAIDEMAGFDTLRADAGEPREVPHG